jgi:hypothetical protein
MLSAMYARWLAATALAYAVLHHLGLLPSGLGSAADGTRVADWLDLAVPWLVLAPAALTLQAAHVRPRIWWTYAAGAVAYTSGHGIHLAANSIGNAAPGSTAHLWDEVVGHFIWYAGVAGVLAALAMSMVDRPRPSVLGYLLAVAVGLTWASNAVGGGTEWFSLAVSLVAAWWGWTQRRQLGGVLAVGFAPAAVGLVGAVAGIG